MKGFFFCGAVVAGLVVLAGCTTVTVQKDPEPCDHGFRYWRPKPYLFIAPPAADAKPAGGAGDDAKKPDGTAQGNHQQTSFAVLALANQPSQDGDKAVFPSKVPESIKVAMQIKYLPDYNEEYSIKLRSGIGSGHLEFKLEDGWNLTSVGATTDQQVDKLISSLTGLIGTVGGLAAGGGSPGGGAAKKPATNAEFREGTDFFFIVDTRPDVPLGFYEPVIATDPTGHKSLFGWRYVGFIPFAGCPVQPCVQPQAVECNPHEIWGLVAAGGTIKFQRLTDIQDPTRHWPYRFHKFSLEQGAAAPPPGQQPVVPKKDK